MCAESVSADAVYGMPTIYEVAKLAGVSPGTVSNVLNHSGKVAKDTEERILQVIQELNYVPNKMAQGLKTNNSKNIFVIAEDIRAFPAPNIIDGISEYSYETGYNLTLYNLRIHPKVRGFNYSDFAGSEAFHEAIDTAVQQARAINASGVLYVSIYPRDIENILPDMGIPYAFCYSYSHGDQFCVNCDDFGGGKMATNYLISMGHRKIGLICGVFDSLPTHKRLLGYQTALMEHNLPHIPKYVQAGASWSYEDGYQSCKELLSLPDPPTAIFAMSDVMAQGAIHAAQDMGLRVPEDLSVHGYDRIEYLEYTRPALTTIEMPLKEIGRKGAEVIIKLIEKKPPRNHSILVGCSHVARGSVKKL